MVMALFFPTINSHLAPLELGDTLPKPCALRGPWSYFSPSFFYVEKYYFGPPFLILGVGILKFLSKKLVIVHPSAISLIYCPNYLVSHCLLVF